MSFKINDHVTILDDDDILCYAFVVVAECDGCFYTIELANGSWIEGVREIFLREDKSIMKRTEELILL